MKKKYKALMLDLDGTTIPNTMDGLPSAKVKEAIRKANKTLHVGVATARPLFLLDDVLHNLELSGPSIITGGSQIIDCPSKKIIWDQPITKSDLSKINKLCQELDLTYSDELSLDPGNLSEERSSEIYQMYFGRLTLQKVERIITTFSSIPSIALHKIPSWGNGLYDLVITHAIATKQHGILEVAKILGIETHEIIGVGDGYNDFPLLMACGLKVAMGNAVPELKEIADYIAPTVDNDGVADVIEKFVL
jgi:HAD superfamily hydrolase (TIGR01484 family)